MSDHHRTSSVSAMLTLLQCTWRSVKAQHRELCLIMLYKIIHGLVELNLLDYIIPAPHITRGHTMKFVQPAMYTDQYKYSFFPNSISLWNKLPSETATIVNLNDSYNHICSYLEIYGVLQ